MDFFTHQYELILLFISLVVLLAAPLIYNFAQSFRKVWRWIDRVMMAVVCGLVVLHLLPEAVEVVGYGAMIPAGVGFLLPSLVERSWHHLAKKVHLIPVVISVIGIAIHGFTDGMALSPEFHHACCDGHHSLPAAVLLHRLPVGILIWSIFYPRYGLRVPSALLGAIAASTVVGFFGAALLPAEMVESQGMAYFEALVAGSLLHLGFDRHDSNHKHSH